MGIRDSTPVINAYNIAADTKVIAEQPVSYTHLDVYKRQMLR